MHIDAVVSDRILFEKSILLALYSFRRNFGSGCMAVECAAIGACPGNVTPEKNQDSKIKLDLRLPSIATAASTEMRILATCTKWHDG
jgi:hypothetical protein